MKKTVYLLILSFILIASSCKKDGDLYFLFRPSNPNNMITEGGAELYTYSVKDSVVKLASYYARVQGEFSSYGDKVVQYGHCWGTSENPIITVDTLMTKNDIEGGVEDSSIVFESRMNNLLKETTYNVRSYIITVDEAGNKVDTGYNVNNLQFTTLPPVNEWLEKTGGGRPGARFDAIAFNKGDTVYFGTGNQSYIGAGSPLLRKDMWRYDPVEDAWTQFAAIPTPYDGVTGAVGFALTYYYASGQKTVTRLYVGLGDYVGNDNGADKTQKFYEYDIDANLNVWTPIPNFQGFPVSNAVCFTIDNRAYVGTGNYYNPRSEWYLFDPSSFYDANDADALWRTTSFPNSNMLGREGAIAFSVNGRGYFGLGLDSDGNFLNDFYEFTPKPDIHSVNEGVWDSKKPFPGAPRANAVGFRIDDQGFVGTGDNITAWDASGNATAGDAMSDFYQYDPFNNIWYTLADYTINQNNTTPKKITRAVGFYSTSDDVGYIGFGYVVQSGTHTQEDLWYYRP